MLIDRLDHYRKDHEKKKRALRNYTISFVGETKVGKSTLHAIICGEGDEFIGVGKQRTTRYNRVYTWQNLRIIDTPGIGAPGGKKDEDIAKDIVAETDIICFMTKNDNVQETEFKFLQQIRQHNKPVIILLNVKENIIPPRLKHYLQDPDYWYTREDEKSLRGHCERIRRFARTYYYNDRFDIYPVHLLAARMSKDPRYQEHAAVLYNSSRMQDFLDAIRLAVIEEGPLRRSQTLLGGMLSLIDETQQNLRTIKKELQENRNILTRKNNTLEQVLRKQYDDSKRKMETAVQESFGSLYSQAYSFSSDHYKSSQETIQKEWQQRLRRSGFEGKLESSLKRIMDEYVKVIEEYLAEVTDDLKAFQKVRFGRKDFQTGNLFSMQTVLDWGGIVGGVGGATVGILGLLGILSATIAAPVGIAFAVVAGLQLIKGWFKSNKQVERDAIEKLYTSMTEHIRQQSDDVQRKLRQDFEQKHQKIVSYIRTIFSSHIKAIDAILMHIQTLEDQLAKEKKDITKVFAWRIVNYATQGGQDVPIPITDQVINETIVYTERTPGRQFVIACDAEISPDVQQKLSKILQEEVKILGRTSTATTSNI